MSLTTVWVVLVLAVGMLSEPAWAGALPQLPLFRTQHELSDRIASFPNWTTKPPVKDSEGDLVYPDWFEGEWQMTSTLVNMVAPLAPDVITPGFEGNRQFLDRPITAPIRFVRKPVESGRFLGQSIKAQEKVVSDRAFNGLSLARAYLGDEAVDDVKVDPDNANRQITFLNDGQQLSSTVTGRLVEQAADDRFTTTEIFQQFFGGDRPTIYLNAVENTTAYHQIDSEEDVQTSPVITADQITAIYLSPQDPDYFKARDKPVALYRYRLDLKRD
ncbi:MAG: DUF6816 family protein [Cyanobacteria bacterium P01_F01_bin.150]